MDTQTEMIFEEAASMEDMKSEVLSALGKKKDPPSVMKAVDKVIKKAGKGMQRQAKVSKSMPRDTTASETKRRQARESNQ